MRAPSGQQSSARLLHGRLHDSSADWSSARLLVARESSYRWRELTRRRSTPSDVSHAFHASVLLSLSRLSSLFSSAVQNVVCAKCRLQRIACFRVVCYRVVYARPSFAFVSRTLTVSSAFVHRLILNRLLLNIVCLFARLVLPLHLFGRLLSTAYNERISSPQREARSVGARRADRPTGREGLRR